MVVFHVSTFILQLQFDRGLLVVFCVEQETEGERAGKKPKKALRL